MEKFYSSKMAGEKIFPLFQMNSKIYLFRCEGVNLDAYVFNTRDLSTIRGAGLSLLESIKTVEEFLDETDHCMRFETLSKGASAGLFKITCNDPNPLRASILGKLSDTYPYATFVCEWVPLPENEEFGLAREKVLACCRWAQAMGSSLSLPEARTSKNTMPKPACGIDGIHPAVEDEQHRTPNRENRDKNSFVSERTFALRKFGKSQKQIFYRKFIEDPPQFAEMFEDIAHYELEDKAPLNDKMAVFYADGNGFGKIQARHCTSPETQKAFDKHVRRCRKSFLRAFLSEATAKPAWKNPKKKECIRFETLLWGGDEMIFVMPARFGWTFARTFFQHLGSIPLSEAGESCDFPKSPLTYTASLVYCHHHSPIERVKTLATGIADFAKNADGGKGRDFDQLVYTALESFDHLGPDFEEALKTRYGKEIEPSSIILRAAGKEALAEKIGMIGKTIRDLHDPESGFARSQLRRLVDSLLADPSEAQRKAPYKEWPKHAFRNASDDCREALKEFSDSTASPLAAWIHLEELWDYAAS